MGKMSDHELLSPDNSGSGWGNVLLAQKINKRGVAIRMSWYASFGKINSRGDVYSGTGGYVGNPGKARSYCTDIAVSYYAFTK